MPKDSDSEKVIPKGGQAPDWLIGNWGRNPCYSCCVRSLRINDDLTGEFDIDEGGMGIDSDGCAPFHRSGLTLYDSTENVIWIDRHRIRIVNYTAGCDTCAEPTQTFLEISTTGKKGNNEDGLYKRW
ncbi:MAG: hypothetical protein MRY83_17735 [Flavobacteriales bacterium]|nr:hypothetical protein [Flavobacteriales bacterium]